MLRLISMTLSLACCLSVLNLANTAPIVTINDAMVYLARFGYVDPGYENPLYSPILSTASFSNALENFQSFTGFKKTGKLDAETLKFMNKPRCGVPDHARPGYVTRQKRFVIEGSTWPKKQLTYTIKKYSSKMSKSDVDREIARALQVWADVSDLTFVHLNETAKVDIEISFEFQSINQGLGNLYAYATFSQNGGAVHFDDSVTWTLNSDKGINLFQVATHELGHSLGLNHTDVTTSVMHNVYNYSSDFKLDKDDIEGIQKLYGENPSRKLKMELKEVIVALKGEWVDTKNKLEAELKGTKQDLEKTIADLSKHVNDLSAKLNERTSEIVDIGKMPTNCEDLQRMGQKLSGFFSVKGPKKMEMIYCDFFPNQNDKQKWIGYADVKSALVNFYVQRNSNFNTIATPIPFDLAVHNAGNALDLKSGKFTAPLSGIYFFSFTGLANFPPSPSRIRLSVSLSLNGFHIGSGYVEEANVAGQNSPLTIQSTLKLKKGDQIWVEIGAMSSGVYLADNDNHYTHFTGFMLEEEISKSL